MAATQDGRHVGAAVRERNLRADRVRWGGIDRQAIRSGARSRDSDTLVNVRFGLALLVLAGCDQAFGLEGRESRTCASDDVFGAGQPVPIEGIYSVEAARFDPTQSIAYLSLCAQGDKTKDTCDLYQSTYARTTNQLSFYAKLGINSPTTYDSYGTITPDAQYLVFGSSRQTGVGTFISTANNGQFIAVVELSLIANESFANEPYLLGDGQTLYLAGGAMGDTTSPHIYRARGGPPMFGGGSDLVAGVNGASRDFAPVVSDDELEIFFSSDRESTGMPMDMPLDIFVASRDAATDSFGTPRKLPAVSTTSGIDWPVWLSPNRCDLYYINKVNDFATLLVAHR